MYEGSKSKQVAEKDGLKVLSNSEAVKQSDIIMFCLPDTIQGKVYKEDVEENLTEGKMLMFCHGFSIFYEQIKPPEFVDVAMIAPKGPGHIVRRVFESGQGVPCLVAVYIKIIPVKPKKLLLVMDLELGAPELESLKQHSKKRQKLIYVESKQYCVEE